MLGPRRKKRAKPVVSSYKKSLEADHIDTSSSLPVDAPIDSTVVDSEIEAPPSTIRTFEDVFGDDDYHGLNYVETSKSFFDRAEQSNQQNNPSFLEEPDQHEIEDSNEFEMWELERLKASGIKLKNLKSKQQQNSLENKLTQKSPAVVDAYNQSNMTIPKRAIEPLSIESILLMLQEDIDVSNKSYQNMATDLASINEQIEKYEKKSIEIESSMDEEE